MHNGKPSNIISDRIKYLRIDTALRSRRVLEWNQPLWWPLLLPLLSAAALGGAAWRAWRRREMATGRTA